MTPAHRPTDRRPHHGRRSRRPATVAVAVALCLALVAAACGSDDEAATDGTAAAPGTTLAEGRFPPGTTVRLLTHDSFNLSEDVLADFEAETGLEVEIVRGGDAVTVVNQAILTAGRPQGDVLFGIDDNLLAAASEAELFLPYEPAALDEVPDELEPDTDLGVTPIDVGDVCVNYDRAWFDERDVEVPTTLGDLVDPAYEGLLVVEDPASSTPGLAFLLATVAAYGEDGWLDWWEQLADNDVAVTAGWEQAYYGEFSGGSGEGQRPLVVSYATSPPAEVVFSEDYEATGELPEEAPTGVITDTCIRQVEYAGVLRGTEDEAAAQALVDFLLSPEVQADIPLQMFVTPVLEGVEVPEVFTRFAADPAERLSVPYEDVAANRDEWVQAWTDVVVR